MPVIAGGLTLSKAFNQAFVLLKDSATKEEYRAKPYDDEGGFGAQDFELARDRDLGGIGTDGKAGGYAALFPNRQFYYGSRPVQNEFKAHSYSRINPFVPKRFQQDFENDNLQNTNFEHAETSALSRLGAHEAGHQALHSVDPRMVQDRKNGGLAHELGAFAAEFAAMKGPFNNIREKYIHAQRHPDIPDHGKEQIQQILNDLKVQHSPDKHAQTMGNRARANAETQIELIERVKNLDGEIEEVTSRLMALDYESNAYMQDADDLYAEMDVLEKEREALNNRIAKADITKAPLYYPQEEELPSHIEGGPYPRDKALFPDLMSDLIAPAGFSDVSWESQDGLARGVAQQNWDTGQVNVHHFEVATTVRDGGLGESYLREMIAELDQEMAGQTELAQFHAHATKVEPAKAGFWDKMVDRGAISSASSRTNPRVTVDGKNFAPKIGSDKLQPWEWANEDEI